MSLLHMKEMEKKATVGPVGENDPIFKSWALWLYLRNLTRLQFTGVECLWAAAQQSWTDEFWPFVNLVEEREF